MARKTILSSFEDFRGNDLGASVLTREEGFTTGATNVRLNDDLSATKRIGRRFVASNIIQDRIHGLFSYTYLNKITGGTEEELLFYNTDDGALFVVGTGTLTISSTDTTPTVNILVNTSTNTYEIDLLSSGASKGGVFPMDLGDMFGPVTRDGVVDVETNINNEPSVKWTATKSSGDNAHADALPVVNGVDVSGSGTILTFLTATVVDAQTTNPTLEAFDVGYTNPSSINLNDVLYFATNDDYIYKYDGQSVYRAGVPSANHIPQVAANAAGTLTGTYQWGYKYVQVDARGGRFESDLTLPSASLALAGDHGDVTFSSAQWLSKENPYRSILRITGAQSGVTTIDLATASTYWNDFAVGDDVWLQDTSTTPDTGVFRTITAISETAATVTIDGANVSVADGAPIIHANSNFNYNSAIVDGAQGPVTQILVESTGHTLQVGDTAYFYDSVSGTYVDREITARDSTHITIDGAAVTVADTDPISANLRVAIYRTKDGLTELYLVNEIPNDVNEHEQTYADDMADADLGAKYITPLRAPDAPPKCTYLTQHQGVVIAAGDFSQPNTIFFSEPDNIEAFPVASNNFDIPFTTKGPITGIISDQDYLIVFKQLGRAIVRGELQDNTFSVEVIEDGIGCYAHAALIQTPIGIMFPSRRGFQRMSRGRLDQDFATRTAAIFQGNEYEQVSGTAIATADESKLVFKRATAVNDWRKSLYICYVPAEQDTPGTDRIPTPGSDKWYTYDYRQDAWWDDVSGDTQMNANGGMVLHADELYMANTYLNTAQRIGGIYKEYDTGTDLDYADGCEAINFVLPTTWEDGGEPSIFQKFLREKTWMVSPGNFLSSFVLTVKTFLNFDSTTAKSTFTQTFSASTETEKNSKMLGNHKAQSIQLEFSNNVIHEKPIVSGYELTVAPVYRKEIKE